MPSLAWTWTTLLEKLQKWPRATSTEFLDQCPTLIGLGERRLWRELNVEEYDKTDESISMTTGTREVPKPADVIQLRTPGFFVQTVLEDESTEDDFDFLELRSFEFCRMYAPRASVQGKPVYYCELDSGRIYVVPTPDEDYPMQYRYIGVPTETLSPDAPSGSSWLARVAPDALFAACLMEAEHYLKADDRYGDMQTKYYQELLPTVRLELRGSIRAGDYSPLKPAAQLAG